MATRAEDAGTGRDASRNQVALVILGLVALLGVLWFVFLRGGSPETPAALPTPVITEAPEVEPTEEPRKGGDKGRIETFEVFAPKDPFKPVISEATAGDTGTTVTTGAPATDTGTTDGTGGTTSPSGGSDIGRGADGGGGGSSVGGHRVRLIDTITSGGEARARVQVDGTVYTVSEGDRFADNFELLSVNGQCASMLFGDDQFSLCEGEEILK